jgi:4-amino-4-deoxy-L-arabinose transferase-like glycosyltransferase
LIETQGEIDLRQLLASTSHALRKPMSRNQIIWILFSVVALEAIFSIPLLSWELAVGNAHVAAVLIILAATCLLCWTIWRWREQCSKFLCSIASCVEFISARRWLIGCFLLGAALRLLWAWRYPTSQHSDHATYFELARLLLSNHHFGVAGGGLAYWPPGYPFFLAIWFFVFGVHPWVPLLANIALFGGTLVVVERLTTRIAGATAGKLSSALLVTWPTLVMTALLASKEMLVLYLLCLALLTFANAQDCKSRAGTIAMVIVTGLILGCGSLTQPSIQLFPSVLLVYVWLRKQSLFSGMGQVLLVTLALSAVILPWSIRNHQVLGVWVPISTNGGDVFYRANNPLATGGYTPQGEQNLEGLDEVTRGKVGFRLGKEWILAHPARFLTLSVRKQILFLGDDAQGAYETLKRGLGIGGLTYFAWKGISNSYWLGLWLLIWIGVATHWRGRLSQDSLLAALMLSVLYLYAIHSVFESGAKYHQPVMGFVAVLAGLAFVRPDVPRRNTGA